MPDQRYWEDKESRKNDDIKSGMSFNNAVAWVISGVTAGQVDWSDGEQAIQVWFDKFKKLNGVGERTAAPASVPRTIYAKDIKSLSCSLCSQRNVPHEIKLSREKKKPYCGNWQTHKANNEFANIEGGDKDQGRDMVADPPRYGNGGNFDQY